jgi:hypothetical protein
MKKLFDISWLLSAVILSLLISFVAGTSWKSKKLCHARGSSYQYSYDLDLCVKVGGINVK